MLISCKRKALDKGDILELESYDSQHHLTKQKIVVEKQIGEGASCLSYLVRAYIDTENSRRMVLKEFYPDPYASNLNISRDPQSKKLNFHLGHCISDEEYREESSPESSEEKEYKKRKKEFTEAFMLQNSLSDAECGETMVKPYKLAKFGDSLYILSDTFSGRVMCDHEMINLEEKLVYMGRLVEAVELIHEQGYFCVDLHPENVLCIDVPKLVKLFDVDSLIRTDGSDLKETLKMKPPYGAPEIETIKNKGITREWKRKYLRPGLDIYPLGIMMFELLFGRVPLSEDIQSLKKSDLLIREICKKENLLKDTIINRLRSVLLRSMSENYYVRFPSAREMYDEINMILKEIGALPFIPKKKIAEANYTFLSYHILEKFPVYHYAETKNGIRNLDVSITGSHKMRRQMLKSVLSCAQMLNSNLTIRIIAEDAKKFWEEFTSENENPDLSKAVVCHLEDEEAEDTTDRSLVDKKLADIRLYPYKEKHKILNLVKKTGSGYVLLFGDEEENLELAEEIISQEAGGCRKFIGYLTGQDHQNIVQTSVNPLADCYAMGMKRVTEEYNEAIFRSRIYKMGLQVHSYYYRGSNTAASRRTIEEDYRSSLYNMESSQRCALHGIYKMASVGIDRDSLLSSEEFYEKVLSSDEGKVKENFDNLVYLEHRSWTAFMLTQGHVQTSREKFRNYAYIDGNDWKDKRDKNHIKHPCLAACAPGRGLKNRSWSELLENMDELDPLDQSSLWMYLETCKIAEKRESSIYEILQEMDSLFDRQNCASAEKELQWLKTAVGKCYKKDINGEKIWKKAAAAFIKACEKEDIYELKLKEDMEKLTRLMQPALRVIKKIDYKVNDENILRALPVLMEAGNEEAGSRRILVRPVSENPWQNIFGCLLLEPHRLILVSDEGDVDPEYYRKFLCDRGLDKVAVSTRLSHFSGAKVYIDFTGTESSRIKKMMNYPQLKNASAFTVENGKIQKMGDSSVEMFQKDIHLTVEDILYLAKGQGKFEDKDELTSDDGDMTSGLEWQQCRGLWMACKKGNISEWRELTETLQDIEKKKRWCVKINKGQIKMIYHSVHIPAALLTLSGLRSVLRKCRKLELIDGLELPQNNYDIPVQFRTSCEELGMILVKFIEMAVEKPFEHYFVLSEKQDETLEFLDNTLYVDVEISRNQIIRDKLEQIYTEGGFELLQNLKISSTEKGTHISFRYATESVRETLRNAETILKAVVYQECIRNDAFDDVRMISRPEQGKNQKHIPGNYVDLIGVKKSVPYFISLTYHCPDRKMIEELDLLSKKISADGQVILIYFDFMNGETGEIISDIENRCAQKKIIFNRVNIKI